MRGGLPGGNSSLLDATLCSAFDSVVSLADDDITLLL